MPKGKDGLFMRNGVFGFRYQDANARWREKSTGKAKRSEARVEKKQFLELLKSDQIPTELAKRSVAQAVQVWLNSMTDELSRNTIRSYRTNLNQVVAVFGDRKLGSISIADLREYRASRKKAGRANRTVNHELLCFSFILKEANVWKKLSESYVPLKEGTKHSTRKPLTPTELNTLVSTALGNPSWEVTLYVMLLAANTTCRPCEISGLQLGRIHPDGEYPYVTISRVTTKTDAGERDIPLNRVAQLAIYRLLERAHSLGAQEPEHYLLPADMSKHTKPTDPLYKRRHDGFDPSLCQRDWGTSWNKLRIKAGLPHVQFYQLRHTSITAGAEENVPLAVMKALAGHMDTRMTDYYTSVRDNPKAKAVAAIEQANPQLLVLLGIENGREGKIQ